jgi:2-hydroxy-6-oxonona-2,4-dienedioate hydrolase
MLLPILEEVRKTAAIMGHCDPQWLRSGVVPNFQTTEPCGNGAPLLLLHGLFGALSNWEGVLPHFQKFSSPIALEFGLINLHRSEVKVKALAAYTEYFLRTRALTPIAICGNSMGGHVALRLALARPELVKCLVLTGTSGLYEHSVDTLPMRFDERFVREHMARVFFSDKFITNEAVNEIAKILSNRSNVLNLIHAARSAKKDNLLKVLKDIKAPTLLLWGEDDEVTTMDVAEMFHKNIPNSKLVTIKNCGHAPMIEHPEWFAGEVDKFLGTLP